MPGKPRETKTRFVDEHARGIEAGLPNDPPKELNLNPAEKRIYRKLVATMTRLGLGDSGDAYAVAIQAQNIAELGRINRQIALEQPERIVDGKLHPLIAYRLKLQKEVDNGNGSLTIRPKGKSFEIRKGGAINKRTEISSTVSGILERRKHESD